MAPPILTQSGQWSSLRVARRVDIGPLPIRGVFEASAPATAIYSTANETGYWLRPLSDVVPVQRGHLLQLGQFVPSPGLVDDGCLDASYPGPVGEAVERQVFQMSHI